MSAHSSRTNGTKSSSAAALRRRRLLAEQCQDIYYNPISRFRERIEVYGLTLYDIYREPRCISSPSTDSHDKARGRNTDVNADANADANVGAKADEKVDADVDADNLEVELKVSAPVTTTPITQRNYNKHITQTNIIKANTDIALINNKKNFETKIKSLKNLNSLFQCPICLGYMKKTFIVMECLHRFCGECIQKCLRVGKKECPSCRVHIPSRRSLRPDLSFDDVIGKVYGVNDVAALEEEKALEIETLNRERNMNNAYSESRKLGIMQQAILRQRKISKGTKQSTLSSIAALSHNPDSNASSSQASTIRRHYRSHNSNNAVHRTSISLRPAQPMVRVSKLQDHSSPLVDFIVRRHPMEKAVDRLRKELLRTSKEMRVGQLKRFLGLKLSYEPWSHFQIYITVGGKSVVLDNSIKLARVFADVCGNNMDASLVFLYRIQLSL